jgi:hypothetical protein
VLRTIELPDWVRGYVILARGPDDTLIPLLADADGQLNVLVRGTDGTNTIRTVRVDDQGQLYAILRGASGADVGVDADGRLGSVMYGKDGSGTLITLAADSNGQLVTVPRGASGNYLDVDANGFLTAVLKGIYGGAFHTIAVDEEGRIEAFGLDAEDQWGKTLKTGNSELAARLSPLRTYDWRGNTLFQTDFSAGMPTGYTAKVGTGADVALDPTYWRTGGYSLKLTGGSGASDFAFYEMDQANPPARYLGVQIEFSNYPNGNHFSVTLGADYLGNLQRFGLTFDFVNNQLQYRNNTGGWTNFYAHSFVHRADLFYRMKFVVDVQTGKYLRCLFLDKEIDMSSYSGWTTAALLLPYIAVGFGMYSRTGYNDPTWIDNFVITTNEPV